MKKTRLQRLYEIGISPEQIEQAKNEFPKSIPILDIGNIEIIESLHQELIPVSKIKSLTNRIDISLSWFDNFINNPCYRQSEKGSFEELLVSIEQRGLDDFIESFQRDQESPIIANYYEDFDCYTIGEGKHRATFAKVIGMERIKAVVVTFKSNPIEVNKYLYYQEQYSKLKKAINLHGFEYRIKKKENGIHKKDEIIIYYRENMIITLEAFKYYFNDIGEMNRNLDVINQVNSIINKISGIKFKSLKNLYIMSKINKKGDPLVKIFLSRLKIKGYFR